jgi:uncharacterized protein YceK
MQTQLDAAVESHPFGFAQGRLLRKSAQGWGTRSSLSVILW